ncbi:MAG: peptidase M23 [Micavibrio aeruginosavorus]|uniref:Peptidase M23 n=1 Tax=Micavibrio aeruginosavorus TaxID=349221 RepID=A0A2W5FNZ5_9BACT|nr:MAG: peptidase M23 [Micavibrio aeruginosavorus]
MTFNQLPGLFNAFSASALFGTINRIIPFKTRHILTRHNRLRLRYVVSTFAVLSVMGALSARTALRMEYTAGPADNSEVASIEPEAGNTLSTLNPFRDSDGQIRRETKAIESAALVNDKPPVDPSAPVDVSVEVGRGDTFSSVLVDAGVPSEEAHNVVEAVSEHFNMKKLRAGQKLDLRLEPDNSGSNLNLAKVSFTIDPLKTLHIERDEKGDLNSRLDEKEVNETRRAARVVINGSLYGSAEKANLPDTITANAIKMFSYAVDFQRDIKQGDKLEVLYDTFETTDGYIAKTGNIVHARMMIGGKEFSLYRFKDKDGNEDYYTQDGKSVRKGGGGLMKTPIAFGRVSSGFGQRKHPVLGFTKMHKGIDFAAPTGTAIYAAADGKIEKAGRFSSYGNYVKIRHNSKMSTAYAHVSRFASGIRPGSRVKQGQVIAYVGTTGRSTGPHLHFEVMMNGVQVNPRSVKLVAEDKSLKGEQLRKFKAQVRSFDQEYVRKTSTTRLASARGTNAGSIE